MSQLNRGYLFSTARRLRLRSTHPNRTEHSIDFLKVIRDQMLFVATFFAIFGLITTDTYYSQFGIKYQFLGLDNTHILYRGFALLYAETVFTVIFVAIIIAVLFHKISLRIPLTKIIIKGEKISYVLLSTALAVGGYLSFSTGERFAVNDMYLKSTTLQRLNEFYSPSKEKLDLVNKLRRGSSASPGNESALLLLHSSAAEIVVFKAPTIQAERPEIDIFHIRISDNDHFSHAPP